MPCRVGNSNWPTNDLNASSVILPSTALPPIGFGRSQTTTFLAKFFGGPHAVGHRVDKRVDAAADILQIDDDDIEIL